MSARYRDSGRRHPYNLDRVQRDARRARDAAGEVLEGIDEFFDHAIIRRPKRQDRGLFWGSRWDYRSGRAARLIAASAELAAPRRRRKRVWRYIAGTSGRFVRIGKAFTQSGRWSGYWLLTATGKWVYRGNKEDVSRAPIAINDWLVSPAWVKS